jgi:hypothetical protein
VSRRPALHLSRLAGEHIRHGVGIIEGSLRHELGVDPVLVVVEVRGPPVVEDFPLSPPLGAEDFDHRFRGGANTKQRWTTVISGRSRTSRRTRGERA